MKSFAKTLPPATQVTGAGDPAGDANKIIEALIEVRGGVPNQASEVNALPASLANASNKILDTSLASAFVKTVNGTSPDSNGNVSVTSSTPVDTSSFVQTSGSQTISGTKTFTSPPASSADAVNANDLVRKSQLDVKANASATVNLSGDQTVSGTKTFSIPPTSTSAATTANQLVRKNELDLKADISALSSKADTSAVVQLTGNQTIAGVKTFSSAPVSATTASADSQLINFGQVKSLIPGMGTPSTLLASQDFTGIANGTTTDYDINVIPNGNATGASVTVQNGALRFTSPASGEVNRKFWYSDSPASDADIRATFWWDGTGTSPGVWLQFRIANNSSVANRGSGSMIQLSLGANEVNVGRSNNGSYSAYSSFAGPKAQTWTANAKYKFRALLVGQRVRYKIWLATDSEPNAWLFDYVDPVDFAGAAASFGVQVTAGGTATNFFVDDVSWYTPATGTVYAQSVNGAVPDSNGNITVSTNNPVTSTTVTAATTLALSNANAVLEVNSSSATNVTVPANANTAFPIGTVIEIAQIGAGQVTLVSASGVTLQTPSTLKTRVQYSTISLRKRAADTWIVAGDLA